MKTSCATPRMMRKVEDDVQGRKMMRKGERLCAMVKDGVQGEILKCLDWCIHMLLDLSLNLHMEDQGMC